jgi:glycosyltransferase involved in cell wall biosynthesis
VNPVEQFEQEVQESITALIPTKNRAQLLLRAINSVLGQSYSNVQVLVRDNCSTDDTGRLLRDLSSKDRRVLYNSLSLDIGGHENFRQGLREIKTKYFSILSDDDYLEKDFYRTAIQLLEENPSASFVVFSVDVVNVEGKVIFNNGKPLKDGKSIELLTAIDGINGFLDNRFPYTWTGYVFKKEVADEIDLGEFSEVGYGADIRFIWHAACRFNFVVTNMKGANFLAHENSTSGALVKVFDERFIYWWRNRILIIMRDNKINSSAREALESFYLRNSRVRYSNKMYYLREAFNLVSKRLAAKEEADLRFDFIAMRSFLPAYMLLIVRYLCYPLEEKFGLMTRLKSTIKSCKNSLLKGLS